MLLVLATATAVSAKIYCPPGRFTIRVADAQASATIDGMELVLGHGTAALAGRCAAARSGGFRRDLGHWVGVHVRAKWPACRGLRAMRARWSFEAAFCSRLDGFLRTGAGQRVSFIAERIPECGNGLREAGEQCDGSAGTPFGYSACCQANCQVAPGCVILCDTTFPCEGADEICQYTCGYGGVCKPRAEVACGDAPVCDCDGRTTYPDRCAAFDAGTGVSREGACPAAPAPTG